jgi:N-glycosylase/DNA lyase
MYDRIQDIYNDTDHLATALDAIKTKDDVSQGVLVAVKAALYANSELAGIVSEMFCEHALPYQTEAIDHE